MPGSDHENTNPPLYCLLVLGAAKSPAPHPCIVISGQAQPGPQIVCLRGPSRDLVEVPQFWNSGVGNCCGNDPRWFGILVSGILEDGINLVEFLGLAIRWFPTTRFPELITILPQNGNPGPIKGAHPKYPISVSCVLLWAAMILLWYSLWPCYGFPVGWLSYCYSCPTGTPVATYVPHN